MSCAAPLSHSKRSVDDKPYWIQPCPGVPIQIRPDEQQQLEKDSESSILQSIITVSKIADGQAKEFREKYVSETFKQEFKKHHNDWRYNEYSWLRSDVMLPIDLLTPIVPKDHLETLKLDDEALKIYSYLQRLAVAFEQVIKDHDNQNLKFKTEFKEAEKHLGKILCEIRDLIPRSKWELFKDATRDIMPDKLRHMGGDAGQQHLRDWMIFRDYMNLIEYIMQVMSFFKDKMI